MKETRDEAEQAVVNAVFRKLDDEMMFIAFARLCDSQRRKGESQAWSIGRGEGGWVVKVCDTTGMWHDAEEHQLGDAINELGNRVMGSLFSHSEGAEA